jgi:hypothetical protein
LFVWLFSQEPAVLIFYPKSASTIVSSIFLSQQYITSHLLPVKQLALLILFLPLVEMATWPLQQLPNLFPHPQNE